MFAVSTSQAMIRGSYIDYEVDGKQHQAYVAVNLDLKGSRPGILVCHEWWGINDFTKKRARDLAEKGYTALVVDMYGKGITADNADAAGKLAGPFYGDRSLFRSRMNAGLELLKKQADVDTTKLGAIGFCFGGSAALELARSRSGCKRRREFSRRTFQSDTC